MLRLLGCSKHAYLDSHGAAANFVPQGSAAVLVDVAPDLLEAYQTKAGRQSGQIQC